MFERMGILAGGIQVMATRDEYFSRLSTAVTVEDLAHELADILAEMDRRRIEDRFSSLVLLERKDGQRIRLTQPGRRGRVNGSR